MSFIIYDLILLAGFLLFFSIFLYTRKSNLKRDGLLLLYRTKWGIKLIDYIGNKYKKTLKVSSYISIATGYVLMLGIFYLIYSIMKIYLFSPDIVRAIKVPPILPLVPYLPQVFKLEFLPPFYFTYWIVILAVIAITHELFHGFFAAYNKVKIKTTGFGFFPFFLPVFLAAFVELDEKAMAKKSKFSQMAVLSAGTFANVLTAIFFFGVLWLFFSLAFAPSGIVFDSYATSSIVISGISMVDGIPLTNVSYDSLLQSIDETELSEIEFSGEKYLISSVVLKSQEENDGSILAYNSAPAIKEGIGSIITEINGVKVDSLDKLSEELSKYSPGEEITVKTKLKEEDFTEKSIFLEEHPENPGRAWLGIGFVNQQRSGLMGSVVNTLSSFREPHVYYEPKFDGVSLFIYNLLWWMILISISVALVNMLPVGIFDGGRFFYLTVLGLTGSEKTARKLFSFSTQFFLFLLVLLMVLWVFSFVR